MRVREYSLGGDEDLRTRVTFVTRAGAIYGSSSLTLIRHIRPRAGELACNALVGTMPRDVGEGKGGREKRMHNLLAREWYIYTYIYLTPGSSCM